MADTSQSGESSENVIGADVIAENVIGEDVIGEIGEDVVATEEPPLLSLRQTVIIGLMVLLMCIIIGVVLYYFFVVRKKAPAPVPAPPLSPPVPTASPTPPSVIAPDSDFSSLFSDPAQQIVIPYTPETGGALVAERVNYVEAPDYEYPGMKCMLHNGSNLKMTCGCYKSYFSRVGRCHNFNTRLYVYLDGVRHTYNNYPWNLGMVENDDSYKDIVRPPHNCSIAREPVPQIPDDHISILYTGDFDIDGNYYPVRHIYQSDPYHDITVYQKYHSSKQISVMFFQNEYGSSNITFFVKSGNRVYLCSTLESIFIPRLVKFKDLSTIKNNVLGQLARCNLFMVPKFGPLVELKSYVHGYYHRDPSTPTLYMGVDDVTSAGAMSNKGLWLYVTPSPMIDPKPLAADNYFYQMARDGGGLLQIGDLLYVRYNNGKEPFDLHSDYRLVVKSIDRTKKLYDSYWNNGPSYMKFDPITL